MLIADVGGTHIRFAMAVGGRPENIKEYTCSTFRGIVPAAEYYFADIGHRTDRALFAVAGPVNQQIVTLTNLAWTIDCKAVAKALALQSVALTNDFSAIALSLPHLSNSDWRTIRSSPSSGISGSSLAVIGPGTGLGVSGLIPDGMGGWQMIAGEGGHVTLAARTEVERDVIQKIDTVFDHVSAERLLSGTGLSLIYGALSGLEGDGLLANAATPERVGSMARSGNDPTAIKATRIFAEMLGTVASDLVLTIGAWSGLFLAGGMVQHLGPAFDEAAFYERFTAKGRFSNALRDVPCRVITAKQPGLIGLAATA